MPADLPTLFALAGTALGAIVIYAPKKAPSESIVSFAPPAAAACPDLPPPARVRDAAATWPALIDGCARGSDIATRIALIDALSDADGAWSQAILERALDDEPDAAVRDAIVAALTHGAAI